MWFYHVNKDPWNVSRGHQRFVDEQFSLVANRESCPVPEKVYLTMWPTECKYGGFHSLVSFMKLVWSASCLVCLFVYRSFYPPCGPLAMLCVCPSPSSVLQRQRRETRPSGLGHSVAATTRDAARTPLQITITSLVGRNNRQTLSSFPLYLQWRSFFPSYPPPLLLTPSLSGSLSSHLLEIVLLTRVYKPFLCSAI